MTGGPWPRRLRGAAACCVPGAGAAATLASGPAAAATGVLGFGAPLTDPLDPVPSACAWPLLHTYTDADHFTSVVGHLRDDQITTAADGRYEIRVAGDSPPTDPDTIQALPGATPRGTTYLMLRTYLGDDPTTPAGGIPLPTLRVTDATGTRTSSPCRNGDPVGRSGGPPAPGPPAAQAADGSYTVVVGAPADRPANADTAHGVAWIPWGPATLSVLASRTMLPSPGFAHAVQSVTAGSDPTTAMGAYSPSSTSCATASFATHGWQDCRP